MMTPVPKPVGSGGVAATLELVLINGERRRVAMPSHTGVVANALDRLDTWIETDDGGWVQKSHVVEVRVLDREQGAPRGSNEEFADLADAAGRLADQADAGR
jgi:hypothetical protein